MKIVKFTKFWLLLLVMIAAVQSCQDTGEIDRPLFKDAHAYNSNVYLQWNEKFLEIERYAAGYRPGPAPRALGYMGFASYEAIISAIPENRSLVSLYNGLSIPQTQENTEYHWPAVVNQVYYIMMERFFFTMKTNYPQLFAQIEQTYKKLQAQYASETSAEVLERSQKHGEAVAIAVYEWSAKEPNHNGFLDPRPASYVPPSGPGLWQPTPPDFGKALFPYWTKGRTFAIREADKLGKKPIPYSEDEKSLFYTQAEEVYRTVNFIQNPGTDPAAINLAYEQKWIAEFWSDDLLDVTFSPPPRLVAIQNQIVARESLDLAGSAELYAKMGMAINDTGIAIWHSKYVYNVERPASYIRRVMSKKYPDAANWLSILNHPYTGMKGITPSFPAYPSGHSGFGGAGAKILSSYFEYNDNHPGSYTFTDNCHINRTDFIGTPRTFSSFKEMGDEDALSRIPLGVHFRMDCTEGVRMGELCAQRVLELPWKK